MSTGSEQQPEDMETRVVLQNKEHTFFEIDGFTATRGAQTSALSFKTFLPSRARAAHVTGGSGRLANEDWQLKN